MGAVLTVVFSHEKGIVSRSTIDDEVLYLRKALSADTVQRPL